MAQPHLIKLIFIVILLIIVQICFESIFARSKNDVMAKSIVASPNTTRSLCGDFIEIGECQPCSKFDKKSKAVDACEETGNKQLVKCRDSKQKFYRGCSLIPWIAERNYWVFQAFMLILGIPSWMIVWTRRRKLEEQARRRLQRQIEDVL